MDNYFDDMSRKRKNKKLFEEICVGYGFEEIEQNDEGIYCHGCCKVHKRPKKMYHGGVRNDEILCKWQIINIYHSEIELV